MAEGDRFTPLDDAAYVVANAPVEVDASSTGRTSIIYAAQTNGSGSTALPINREGAGSTMFRIEQNQSQPFRWNTMGVRIRAVVTKMGGIDDAPVQGGHAGFDSVQHAEYDQPFDSIDGFAVGSMINWLRVGVNGVNIVNTTPGQYMPTFIASMCMNHSRQSLEGHPAMFSPVFDDQYTAASDRYAQNVVGHADHITSPGIAPTGPAAAAIGSDAMTCPSRPSWVDGVTAPYFENGAGVNYTMTDSYNAMCSANARKRAKNWIGQHSSAKIIERIIPLADLCNIRTPGMLSNLRSLMLEIQWTNTDIMTHFSQAGTIAVLGGATARATTWSQFNIIDCSLVTDSYLASISTQQEQTEEKLGGSTTRIAWNDIECMPIQYTPGSQIPVPGKMNLQTVLIMNPIKGLTNGQSQALVGTGGGTVPLGTNSMVYNSPSHMAWLGNTTATWAGRGKRYPYCQTSADAEWETGDALPATTAAITYQGIPYPMTDVATAIGNAFTPAGLYAEYCKAVGRFDKHECSPAISFEAFSKTMPMAVFRPWSDNGAHLAQTNGSLLIRLQGGNTTNIVIVTMRLKVVEITPDGMAHTVL